MTAPALALPDGWEREPCDGVLMRHHLPDGRIVDIVPMMYTVRLAVGPGDSPCYDDGWCYSGVVQALVAAIRWDGTGEPDGWHRHPSTGRRRPDGDASREYVHL